MRTHTEIFLVTLPSITNGRTLPGGKSQKQFATELFNTWRVGLSTPNKKGALIFFVADGGARGKGRIEIEVNRGLNGVVGREWTEQMLARSVLPHLRERQFAAGFGNAIQRLEPRLTRKSEAATLQDTIGLGGFAAFYGALAINSLSSWRRDRTCDSCGAFCGPQNLGPWTVVEDATTVRAGRREAELTCYKCGHVSTKAMTIRKYDGSRRRRDGTWEYYYDTSSSSDGGGSDGGGGGGGDC